MPHNKDRLTTAQTNSCAIVVFDDLATPQVQFTKPLNVANASSGSWILGELAAADQDGRRADSDRAGACSSTAKRRLRQDLSSCVAAHCFLPAQRPTNARVNYRCILIR
jgi:hypothetical protein